MNGIGSSSDQLEEVPAEGGRGLRIRRIVLVATAVACTVGALAASISQPDPKTTAAPVKNTARSSTPSDLATAPVEPPAPVRESPTKKGKQETPSRATAIAASLPLGAASAGIPAQVLEAYRRAADEQAARTPGCHLPWTLLAAIGAVESNHARGGQLTADGTTTSPILGPVLNGGDFASLTDTDGGTLDGDVLWDRAVGPMQFIPSTWSRWATTTRPLAVADPNNIFDATTTAAAYLCANNRDLNNPDQLNQAILSYNRSEAYLRDVLAWNARYASGVLDMPAPSTGSGVQPGSGVRDALARPASTTGTTRHVSLSSSNGPVRVTTSPRKNTGITQTGTVAKPATAGNADDCAKPVSARGEVEHAMSGSSSANPSACTPDGTQASAPQTAAVSEVPVSSPFGPDTTQATGATEASAAPSATPSAAPPAVSLSAATDAESPQGAGGTDGAVTLSSSDSADVAPCGARAEQAAGSALRLGGALTADVHLTDEVQASSADAGRDSAKEATSAETCATGPRPSDAGAGSPASDVPAAEVRGGRLVITTGDITGAVSDLARRD